MLRIRLQYFRSIVNVNELKLCVAGPAPGAGTMHRAPGQASGVTSGPRSLLLIATEMCRMRGTRMNELNAIGIDSEFMAG